MLFQQAVDIEPHLSFKRIIMCLKLCARISLFILSSFVLNGCAMTQASRKASSSQIIDTAFLQQYAETYRFRLGNPSSIEFTPDQKSILFLRTGAKDFVANLYRYDLQSKTETLVLSAQKLLDGKSEKLSDEEKARRERLRLATRGLTSFDLTPNGEKLIVPLSGQVFLYDRKTQKVSQLQIGSGSAFDAQMAPDGKRIAYVQEGDLYVYELTTDKITRLTQRENKHISHGMAEFVAQEEMDRHHGFWWSPDSTQIVYQRTDESMVEELHIMDPYDPGKEPQAWRYPRAGTKNAKVQLGIISILGGTTTWIKWDDEKFTYLTSVKWAKNAPLSITVQNRHQTEITLLRADPKTGQTSVLLEEKDKAWINIDQQMPRWLADGKSFLWTSDRSGHLQLEQRQADGSLLKTLTTPDLGYRELLHVDEEKDRIFVRASANPTEAHLYLLSLSDHKSPPKKKTEGAADVTAVFPKKAATAYIEIVDRLDTWSQWSVKGVDGETLGALRSVAEHPKFEPNFERAEVEVNGRKHYAMIIRPDHQTSEKRPVLVHVYGGPLHQMVMMSRNRYLYDQWLANHGFIVVSIDGRGTPGRGRDWERSIKNNFIGHPLEDQANALLALGKKYPEMDLSRVGILGWSFGGYFSAMAVMQRPDVFHAGVAGAPVTAWKDYDTHYTERYIGLPQEQTQAYKQSSVLTYAGDLQRPLMIVHGTADDNVYFTHAIQMADALFKSGKDFDFVPLAGLTHMVPDPNVVIQLHSRILKHFFEHIR
jgi:dipeptidyl-peptidase 4